MWVTTYGTSSTSLDDAPADVYAETKARLDPDFVSAVQELAYALENVIVHSRDFDLNLYACRPRIVRSD